MGGGGYQGELMLVPLHVPEYSDFLDEQKAPVSPSANDSHSLVGKEPSSDSLITTFSESGAGGSLHHS